MDNAKAGRRPKQDDRTCQAIFRTLEAGAPYSRSMRFQRGGPRGLLISGSGSPSGSAT